MKKYFKDFNDIISLPNIFKAWRKFRRGKSQKPEVVEFWLNLEDNLWQLHRELRRGTYRHGSYKSFIVHDPKKRTIHTSTARDRIVHQLIYQTLYPFYDNLFFTHSYSCRVDKGTQRAVLFLEKFLRQASINYKRPIYVFHGDIEKFFDSVDHQILQGLLAGRISDEKLRQLLAEVIGSYASDRAYSWDSKETKRGLPLGNLVSQLFNNIYLHELDIFAKNQLRSKYYIRYADDFAMVSDSGDELLNCKEKIICFLRKNLNLVLNQNSKVRRLTSGIDWLGCRFYRRYKIIKPRTAQRMERNLGIRFSDCRNSKISWYKLNETWRSYQGQLKWADAFNLTEKLAEKLVYV